MEIINVYSMLRFLQPQSLTFDMINNYLILEKRIINNYMILEKRIRKNYFFIGQ